MKSYIKKNMAVLMILSFLIGLLGSVSPSSAYAEEQAVSPDMTQILIDQFGTTESFIQGYLDQGYNLNEIVTAFYKVRELEMTFDDAILAVHPAEVNESDTVTSDVYTDPIVENKIPLIGVEADQSGILKQYETFTVTEEIPTEVEPETDEDKDKPSQQEPKEDSTEKEPDQGTTAPEESQPPQSEQPSEGSDAEPAPIVTPEVKPDSEVTPETTAAPAVEEQPSEVSEEQPQSQEQNTEELQEDEKIEDSTTIKEEEQAPQEEAVQEEENEEEAKAPAKRSMMALSSTVTPPRVPEKAPVFDRKSFNEAPYTVGENGETISTLSGSLILEHADAMLPGRGGMAFALERQYNSGTAQFYDMDVDYTITQYPIYEYFVAYNAVRKKVTYKYHVKYKENVWAEHDYNGDGTPDYSTAIVKQRTIDKGTYNTEAEAQQVAREPVYYSTPDQSMTVQKVQTNSNSNAFPASMSYNEGGFSGTLNRSGVPQIISGQYTPPQTVPVQEETCSNSLPGRYSATGNWSATGTASSCPLTKTTTFKGQTVILNLTKTDVVKACLSPNKSFANYECTKQWLAHYTGSGTLPASDTRNYSQLYIGTVIKKGGNSHIGYGQWADAGNGMREREAYNVAQAPFVEPELLEGNAEPITLVTDGTDWNTANEAKNMINTLSGLRLQLENGYQYYLAANPAAEIQAYQAGMSGYPEYYNKTKPSATDKRAPLGKGWSWKLPHIDTENGKSFAVLADGSSYEIVGNKLKGTDWEGVTVNTDTSVTVNGEKSQQVITSADGLSKQYFTSDGRLLLLSDSRQNDIQFFYEQNATYQSKLLTQVKDAIGNTIQIDYTPSAVTIKQGDRTITYQKKTQEGVELLDSVIDPLGRKTTYSYKIAAAKFNLLGFSPERATPNPYALLTAVQHETGAKTFYEYENAPVKRYIGADSSNESYRVASRKDQLTYANGTTEDYNRQTVSYTSDLGVSFGQKAAFGATIRNGLTDTQYTYRKEVASADTPAAYYLDRTVVSAQDKTQTTSYTYGKTVSGRNYAAAVPTTVTTTDNQTNDTFTTTSQYDDYGNLTSKTEANGKTLAATYDNARHWLTSATESVDQNNKQVSILTYNAQGDVTQIVSRKNSSSGDLLSQADYTYDTFGNLLTQRLKNGTQDQVTTVQYDPTYQQAFPTLASSVVTDVDGNKSTITTTSTYDPSRGTLLSSTDAAGRKTLYDYDALGRTVQVTQSDNSTLRAVYDDVANRITVTDENGQKRMLQWNALGQQIETGYYEGDHYVVASRIGYDPYGRAIWTEDALGNRTRQDYDAWNRVIATTGADTSAVLVNYNDAARTMTTTDAEGYENVQSSNRWGQVIQIQERAQAGSPLNILQKMTYDAISGKTLTETDGKGQTTSYEYDLQGRLTSVTEPNNEQTRYSYDMLGNLLQTTDAAGNVKQSRFDEIGRRIQTLDKLGSAAKSYYNGDGTLSRFIDRNGNTFMYEYDERGRLLAKKSPDETIRFTVDRAGKRKSMADQTGTTTYAYNEATEQLKQITYPDGLQTSFEYDINGNRTSMTGPFGTTVYYGHDSMNRLTSVGTALNTPDAQYSYLRNGLNREVNSQNGVQTTKTYQGMDLIGLNQVNKQESLNAYTYAYDANKNIVNRVQGQTTDQFTYDQLDRITNSTVNQESYTYDRQGNRLTLTSTMEPKGSTTDYTYDKQNRLTMVSASEAQVGYKYNGDNLLVERTENGKVTRYYYDDNAQIIAEADVQNGTPTLKANYIRGAQLEAIQYADGSKAYVQSNGHGDIIELRDAQGVLLNRYSYDIWGNIQSKQETVYNPFRYSGELWDDTTNLQYLRARWYDPSMGRFINEDTYEGKYENPTTLNLYTYVQNNPLIYTDPSGHYAFEEDPGSYTLIKRATAIELQSPTYWQELKKRLSVIYGKRKKLNIYAEIARNIAEEGVKEETSELIWKYLTPTSRGEMIESILAKYDYSHWYNIGSENGGYFPLIDFQLGREVVSLKTIDPTNYSSSALYATIRGYLSELNSRRILIDGKDVPSSDRILDIRVPRGMLGKFDSEKLRQLAGRTQIYVREF